MSISKTIAVTILALGAACASRPIDSSPGAPDLAASTPLDLAMAPPDLVSACTPWERVRVEPLWPAWGFPASVPVDRTVRLVIAQPIVLDCTRAGPFEISRTTTADEERIVISARRWEREVSRCRTGAGPQGHSFVLRDGTPTGPARVSVELAGSSPITIALTPSTGSACDARSDGAACDRDCQCTATDPEARCLTANTGGTAVCARPCSTSRDCSSARPYCNEAFHCVSTPPMWCNGGCVQPLRCVGNLCQPVAVMAPPPSSCGCDADCPTGAVCAGALGCVVTCAIASHCPDWATACVDGRCQ